MTTITATNNIDNLHIKFDHTSGVEDKEMEDTIKELHYKALDKFYASFPERKDEVRNQLGRNIRVVLNPRMRSCGGRAKGGHVIEMNYRLHKEYPQEIESTYVHELGHIICHILFPKENCGHGDRWKTMMRRMDADASRTHNMDTSKLQAKRKKFSYSCDCHLEHNLSSVRHNKVQKGTASYRCTGCGATLKFDKAL